jgi:peptidoglycan/LPS O-acetylase OafA/YrhL
MQAPEPAVRHRKDVQGLRALAVLIVGIYHADPGARSAGFVGVDV